LCRGVAFILGNQSSIITCFKADIEVVDSQSVEDFKLFKRIRKQRLCSPRSVQRNPAKVEYSLTEMGAAFIPLLKDIRDWGEDNYDLIKK